MPEEPQNPTQAKAQVQREIRKQESKWPEIRALVAALKRTREENHIGPRIEAAFRGEKS